jgi:hypothetical protein
VMSVGETGGANGNLNGNRHASTERVESGEPA